jgi:hypothetical protein
MLNQTEPDALAPDPLRLAGNRFENDRRQVGPVHQYSDVCLLQEWILQE